MKEETDWGRVLTAALALICAAVVLWLLLRGGDSIDAAPASPVVPMICTCVPANPRPSIGPLPHEVNP